MVKASEMKTYRVREQNDTIQTGKSERKAKKKRPFLSKRNITQIPQEGVLTIYTRCIPDSIHTVSNTWRYSLILVPL